MKPKFFLRTILHVEMCYTSQIHPISFGGIGTLGHAINLTYKYPWYVQKIQLRNIINAMMTKIQ